VAVQHGVRKQTGTPALLNHSSVLSIAHQMLICTVRYSDLPATNLGLGLPGRKLRGPADKAERDGDRDERA
jgi:hypothetical protein